MEIGLDYMQMRSRAQHHGLRWTGIGFLIAGAILTLAGIAYYGNVALLRANLDNQVAQRPGLLPDAAAAAPLAPDGGTVITPLTLPAGERAAMAERLDFTPLAQSDAQPTGTLPSARRLMIPELGINAKTDDSGVTGAAIIARGIDARGIDARGADSDAANYASIQANPGEQGAAWFFGEVGDGASSFGQLTDAPELLADGEDILVFLDNGDRVYLYAATHTDVIPSDELRLSSTGRATVHLAVPTPSGLFDHFLVLSGELVGVK